MNALEAIRTILAREVLDSRGQPTVEVEVLCAGGAWGRASVPSGASTGKHEALELRDGDPARFHGRGVLHAVANILGEIAPAVQGLPVTEQALIDRVLCGLDGTPNKSRLGANAILGVSLGCVHAAAAARELPLWQYLATLNPAKEKPALPLPMVNLISGGLHAGRNLDVQDFLLLPIGAASYSEALHTAVTVYRTLGQVLREQGFEGVLVGDEGGFGPRLPSHEHALDLIQETFTRAGLVPGKDVALALDVASTHFFHEGRYHFEGKQLDTDAWADLLERWVNTYPILSLEDGMAEDDWRGWTLLTERLGRRVQLIGDDVFVTNPRRLEQGITQHVANSILIKVNQIGTLTEALQVFAQARAAGYRTIISARSGETEDTTIADLAVGTGAGQIKIGSVARGERLAKYNQLLRIEQELGEAAFSPWVPV